MLVILILSYNEFTEYLTPNRVDTLTVNHESRGETLPINFKVLFLELPCEGNMHYFIQISKNIFIL